MLVTDPFSTKVLDKDVHERLVQNIDTFAADAGIEKKWFWTSAQGKIGQAELDYIVNLRKHRQAGSIHGLVMVRKTADGDPFERMSAMAGVCMRNFLRARVMTLQTVLALLKEGGSIEATLLLIPNFYHSKEEGGTILAWQAGILYDLLLKRAADGVQTVLYATDLAQLGKDYGSAFGRFITSNFLTAEI